MTPTLFKDNTEYTFESNLNLSKQDDFYLVGISFSEAITTLKFRRIPTVSLLTTFIPNVVTFVIISLALFCQDPEFDTSLNGITAFAASNQAITAQFSRSGKLPGLALINTGLQLGSAAEAVIVVGRRKIREKSKKREANRKDKESRAKHCLRQRRWWKKHGDTVERVLAGLICLSIPTALSLYVWASQENDVMH
ncbi:hypothetical protein PRIPAC_87127 [Pristionchus pacificus]|uniref:Uncharacterized protein n=1 Tax=Pristionchus pacificus TaxID=54126 RepID=A0A2A6B3M7_PRIPA|nr:hypothetical protein PRIPAC_87127 [Pristionchus pacificus]|eukprot:PDM60461.1 hypothetical protein PRIPAC_53439 [Pristionchus pacificus]